MNAINLYTMAKFFILGICILVVGVHYRIFPPKEKYGLGYRSSRSTLNRDTWDSANKYAFSLLIGAGCFTLFLGFLSYFLVKDPRLPNTFGIISIPLTFIATEYFLRNVFDKKGNRRKKKE